MGDPGDPMRLLFVVPVCRLSEKEFYAEQNDLMAPHLRQMSTHPDDMRAWTLAAHIVKWHTWDFNDLVGWVTIDGYHDMVKMYLWWTTAKQIRRGGHHVFEPVGKLMEIFIYPEMANEEIGTNVREAVVTAFQKEPPRRRARYLDLRTFDAVSPHLDWRAALRACEERSLS